MAGPGLELGHQRGGHSPAPVPRVDRQASAAGPARRPAEALRRRVGVERRIARDDAVDGRDQQLAVARMAVQIEQIATGEHWYGVRALELKLVDELRTSDDFLMEAAKEHELYHIAFKRRRTLPERMLAGAESLLSR